MQSSVEQNLDYCDSGFGKEDWLPLMNSVGIGGFTSIATDIGLSYGTLASQLSAQEQIGTADVAVGPQQQPQTVLQKKKRRASQQDGGDAAAAAAAAAGGTVKKKKKVKAAVSVEHPLTSSSDFAGDVQDDNNDDDSGSVGSGTEGRHNQRFTELQRAALESVYATAKYQSPSDRAILASSIGVTANRVAAWFQRRRWRDRRRLGLQGRLPDWVPPPPQRQQSAASEASLSPTAPVPVVASSLPQLPADGVAMATGLTTRPTAPVLPSGQQPPVRVTLPPISSLLSLWH